MTMFASYSKARRHQPGLVVLLPATLTLFLWLTTINAVTIEMLVCCFVLLALPCYSYHRWRAGNKDGLPVLALVGFAYWWYFAVGAFWLERQDDSRIPSTLLLAVIGVFAIALGMKVRLPLLRAEQQLELADTTVAWTYVRAVLIVGTIGKLIPSTLNILGSTGRNIVEILISTVPAVALVLLILRYLNGSRAQSERIFLLTYCPVVIIAEIASGWMGNAVTIGLISGAAYVYVKRRVPWKVIMLCAFAVLFLQVGKGEFREVFWYQGEEANLGSKAAFWISKSAQVWGQSLTGENEMSVSDLTRQSLSRTSLLDQVARVLELTPREVPFQRGKSYSYLATTLIPRFLWPDKPSVNEANRYYQVAFGLTKEADLDNVSIAVGCLGEAFLNFGWLGAFMVMVGVGVILGVYQRSFLAKDCTHLYVALGIALLRGALAVEAQMAQYLGGVVQQVALTLLIFSPVLCKRALKTKKVNQSLRSRCPSVAPTS